MIPQWAAVDAAQFILAGDYGASPDAVAAGHRILRPKREKPGSFGSTLPPNAITRNMP